MEIGRFVRLKSDCSQRRSGNFGRVKPASFRKVWADNCNLQVTRFCWTFEWNEQNSCCFFFIFYKMPMFPPLFFWYKGTSVERWVGWLACSSCLILILFFFTLIGLKSKNYAAGERANFAQFVFLWPHNWSHLIVDLKQMLPKTVSWI